MPPGEQPFRCPKCHVSFSNGVRYNRHMEEHEEREKLLTKPIIWSDFDKQWLRAMRITAD